MHPWSFQEFDRLCAARCAGGAVLEVGATPTEDTLLAMPSLAHATSRVGLNLDGPHACQGFKILRGNANAMDCFVDGEFDTVLCNAVLEHDPFFWKTLAEIRRVTKPGGVIAIGTPGYVKRPGLVRGNQWLRAALLRVPVIGPPLYWWCRTTRTLEVHEYPGDYYRFTPETYRDVFLADLADVEIRTWPNPPMIVGAGKKR